jgi:hypothetical protein
MEGRVQISTFIRNDFPMQIDGKESGLEILDITVDMYSYTRTRFYQAKLAILGKYAESPIFRNKFEKDIVRRVERVKSIVYDVIKKRIDKRKTIKDYKDADLLDAYLTAQNDPKNDIDIEEIY